MCACVPECQGDLSVCTVLRVCDSVCGPAEIKGEELASAIGAALGRTVIYAPVLTSVFRTFGFPGAPELADMVDVGAEHPEATPRSFEETAALLPSGKPTTFAEYAAAAVASTAPVAAASK